MKRNYILILSLLTFGMASAQMSMPDSSAVNAPAEVQEKPQIKGIYNTPSESYKDERNAIRRGNKLFEAEKYHQALEAYDKALQVNEGSIRGRYNKAVALLQLQSDDNKGTENRPPRPGCRYFRESYRRC